MADKVKNEMLFVEPEFFGKGTCGKASEYGRSETDGQGNPFPILRMELRK